MLDVVQPAGRERFGFAATKRRTARVNETLRASSAAASPLAAGGIDRLTSRELSVLRLIATGYTNAEIANLLGLSLRSIEASRARIRQHLGLRTRAGLMRFARDAGIVAPGW
jgi:DNA-binding NarL/FixJ family response regulator